MNSNAIKNHSQLHSQSLCSESPPGGRVERVNSRHLNSNTRLCRSRRASPCATLDIALGQFELWRQPGEFSPSIPPVAMPPRGATGGK